MLNSTIPSRFNASTPVSVMVDKLMVEDWSKELSYDLYYKKCAPLFCTYSVTRRKSALLIGTILLGLLGGLNIALKLLTPLLMRLIIWFIKHGRGMYHKDAFHLINVSLSNPSFLLEPFDRFFYTARIILSTVETSGGINFGPETQKFFIFTPTSPRTRKTPKNPDQFYHNKREKCVFGEYREEWGYSIPTLNPIIFIF